MKLYRELVERNEARLDALSSQHADIIESRLGLNQRAPEKTEGEQKPLGRRRWGAVRNEFETQRKKDYWTKKVETVDKKDLEARIDKQTSTTQGA